MTYRVALAGVGVGRRIHLPALRSHPEFEVWAVVARRPEQATAVADEHGIPLATTRLDDVLNDPLIDVIVVAVPPSDQAAIAVRCLLAGKSVLVEKPVGLSAGEARQIVEAAEATTQVGAVNFEFRYLPERRLARGLIQDGFIGTPRWISMSMLGPPHQGPTGWFGKKSAGGGQLTAIGSHMIDAAVGWLGRPLACDVARFSRTPGPDSADSGFLLGMYAPDGARATLQAHRLTSSGPGSQTVLYGDRGFVLLDFDGSVYGRNDVDARQWTSAEVMAAWPARAAHLVASDGPLCGATYLLLDDFAALLEGRTTEVPTLVDGLVVRTLMDAAIEAGESETGGRAGV